MKKIFNFMLLFIAVIILSGCSDDIVCEDERHVESDGLCVIDTEFLLNEIDRLNDVLDGMPYSDTIYDDTGILDLISDLDLIVDALEVWQTNHTDMDTVYDDQWIVNWILAYNDNDTIYDDTDVQDMIDALELWQTNHTDMDTVYDDTVVQGLIDDLVTWQDNYIDNDTIYDDTELRNRIVDLETHMSTAAFTGDFNIMIIESYLDIQFDFNDRSSCESGQQTWCEMARFNITNNSLFHTTIPYDVVIIEILDSDGRTHVCQSFYLSLTYPGATNTSSCTYLGTTMNVGSYPVSFNIYKDEE